MRLPWQKEDKRNFKIGDWVRVVENKESKLLNTQIKFVGKIFQVASFTSGFKGSAYTLDISGEKLRWNFYDINLESIDEALNLLD